MNRKKKKKLNGRIDFFFFFAFYFLFVFEGFQYIVLWGVPFFFLSFFGGQYFFKGAKKNFIFGEGPKHCIAMNRREKKNLSRDFIYFWSKHFFRAGQTFFLWVPTFFLASNFFLFCFERISRKILSEGVKFFCCSLILLVLRGPHFFCGGPILNIFFVQIFFCRGSNLFSETRTYQ